MLNSIPQSYKLQQLGRWVELVALTWRRSRKAALTKIFLLKADDGSEVIARVPTPIAGPPHYTTASEVATIKPSPEYPRAPRSEDLGLFFFV